MAEAYSRPERRASVLRRGRRRTALQVLALVAGVLMLLWGADALARHGAETLLARNISDATAVPEPPEVSVRGVFFLPQVIGGAYEEVDVTTRGITSGPLRLDTVVSRLYDVRVRFHDVLVRDVRRFAIGHSHQELTLTYADLNAYFDATGRPLTIESGDNETVRIGGAVTVLNQVVDAGADVTVAAEDGVLRITPQTIDTGGTALDQPSTLLLRQRLTLTVPLGTLPFGHRLTSVRPYPDGLIVVADADGVLVEP